MGCRCCAAGRGGGGGVGSRQAATATVPTAGPRSSALDLSISEVERLSTLSSDHHLLHEMLTYVTRNFSNATKALN